MATPSPTTMAASTTHSIGPYRSTTCNTCWTSTKYGYAAVGLASVQVVSQCVRRWDQVQFMISLVIRSVMCASLHVWAPSPPPFHLFMPSNIPQINCSNFVCFKSTLLIPCYIQFTFPFTILHSCLYSSPLPFPASVTSLLCTTLPPTLFPLFSQLSVTVVLFVCEYCLVVSLHVLFQGKNQPGK